MPGAAGQSSRHLAARPRSQRGPVLAGVDRGVRRRPARGGRALPSGQPREGGRHTLRARIEDGLASALFLMRRTCRRRRPRARGGQPRGQAGEPDTEIGALSQLGMIDALTGGHEWREALERGRELTRAGPSATPARRSLWPSSWPDGTSRAGRASSSAPSARRADSVPRRAACRGSSRSSGWVGVPGGAAGSTRAVIRRGGQRDRAVSRPGAAACLRARGARTGAGRPGDVEGARATPARRSPSPMNAV